MPGFDETQRWVFNNGFAVVIALLLLLLLRYVIRDAVAHFNQRLDQSAAELSAGFREMASAIRHLDGTLDQQATQLAANHEALSILLRFQSVTQQEIMTHRGVVEGPAASPSPPMQPTKEAQ